MKETKVNRTMTVTETTLDTLKVGDDLYVASSWNNGCIVKIVRETPTMWVTRNGGRYYKKVYTDGWNEVQYLKRVGDSDGLAGYGSARLATTEDRQKIRLRSIRNTLKTLSWNEVSDENVLKVYEVINSLK